MHPFGLLQGGTSCAWAWTRMRAFSAVCVPTCAFIHFYVWSCAHDLFQSSRNACALPCSSVYTCTSANALAKRMHHFVTTYCCMMLQALAKRMQHFGRTSFVDIVAWCCTMLDWSLIWWNSRGTRWPHGRNMLPATILRQPVLSVWPGH